MMGATDTNFTLDNISPRIWYGQKIKIQQEGKSDFVIENYLLQDKKYDGIRSRWIRSMGVDLDGTLTIFII